MPENRLRGAPSSYLRSASHQPVDWFPWGEEAFARAKSEDKPILLDVGAVWCHWCHVIDRESYEDPEIAALINERFVAVKVDRDERPDVDARYQAAVGALTGQGGWPLTAFLTPDGKVFYGGTYFPPKELYGRPSFRRILLTVSDHYKNSKADVLNEANALHAALASGRGTQQLAGEVSDPFLREVADGLRGQLDLVYGGFGTAPKFPHAGTLEFLMARYRRTRDEPLKTTVVKTLEGMAAGGIRDHVGGGFHRYSTDRQWIVPHFEKMAYDNAGLLSNYSHAWQLWRIPVFEETARDIVRWVDEVLSDRRNGGFYGSQDADISLDDDGDFFTWTLDELRAAVTADEAKVLALRFDVGERGEMHHDPKRNVLYADKTPEEVATALSMPADRVAKLLASGLRALAKARAKRKTPFVDATIYANWNGMMASAYLDAWRAFGWEPCRDFAVRTLDRLWKELYDEKAGMYHQLAGGERRVAGLLDDQVQMAGALLDAFEVTAEPRYLDRAKALADFALAHFWDRQRGGFFDIAVKLHSSDGAAPLEQRRRPVEDSPTASPNGVAAVVLTKLAHLTGNEEYRTRRDEVVRSFAGEAARMGGLFGGTYFLAAEVFLRDPAEVVIAGRRDSPETRRLHEVAARAYSPGKTVLVADGTDAFVPAPVAPMLASAQAKEGPVAFVCQGNTCSRPTKDPDQVQKLLAR